MTPCFGQLTVIRPSPQNSKKVLDSANNVIILQGCLCLSTFCWNLILNISANNMPQKVRKPSILKMTAYVFSSNDNAVLVTLQRCVASNNWLGLINWKYVERNGPDIVQIILPVFQPSWKHSDNHRKSRVG